MFTARPFGQPTSHFHVITDHVPNPSAHSLPFSEVFGVSLTRDGVRAQASRDVVRDGFIEALIGRGEGALVGFDRQVGHVHILG